MPGHIPASETTEEISHVRWKWDSRVYDKAWRTTVLPENGLGGISVRFLVGDEIDKQLQWDHHFAAYPETRAQIEG